MEEMRKSILDPVRRVWSMINCILYKKMAALFRNYTINQGISYSFTKLSKSSYSSIYLFTLANNASIFRSNISNILFCVSPIYTIKFSIFMYFFRPDLFLSSNAKNFALNLLFHIFSYDFSISFWANDSRRESLIFW